MFSTVPLKTLHMDQQLYILMVWLAFHSRNLPRWHLNDALELRALSVYRKRKDIFSSLLACFSLIVLLVMADQEMCVRRDVIKMKSISCVLPYRLVFSCDSIIFQVLQ